MKTTHPKLYKILRWSVLVILSILVVLIIAWAYIVKNEKQLLLGLEQIKYDMYMQPYLDEQAKLEAARKVDNVGGKTPEETLDMYIEAFKSGDIEKSIKYYEVADQEKEREFDKKLDFKKAVEWLEYLRTNGKGEYSKNVDGYYSIGYIYTEPETISTTTMILGQMVPGTLTKGATSTVEMIFTKNAYSGLWKIVF